MIKEKDGISFFVPMAIYPKEAILSAANTFSDKAYIKLSRPKKGKMIVNIHAKPGTVISADNLENEFYNELLHHALRLKISQRHHALREKIVVQALLGAKLTSGAHPNKEPVKAPKQNDKQVDDKELEKEIEKLLKEAESGYKADPLDITVPWDKSSDSLKNSTESSGKK